MTFYNKIREEIIGDNLTKTSDYYEKAKILLTYNLSMILVLLLIPISIYLVSVGLLINSVFSISALLFLSSIIALLKYQANVRTAAKAFTIFAVIILIASYSPKTATLVMTNELWYVVLILYVYFTLGLNWAIFSFIAAVGNLMVYVKYFLYDNLHNELVYAPEKIFALFFTIPMAFFAIFYIVHQFMITQKHAEEELKKNYNELEVQHSIIQRKKDEKSAIIKEIHHRVKNNLQIVNSLLRMQSSGIKDKKIVGMFEEAQNRVVSMALLHDNLYKSEGAEDIDYQSHFSSLANELIKSYGVGKDIQLDLSTEKVNIGIKSMVPLGLIVNEIVSNSLKYAFNEKDSGTIIVHLKHLGGKKHELIIGDHGVGMSEEQIKEKSGFSGMELVRIFVEQLEGEMKRLDQLGTVFKINFESID